MTLLGSEDRKNDVSLLPPFEMVLTNLQSSSSSQNDLVSMEKNLFQNPNKKRKTSSVAMSRRSKNTTVTFGTSPSSSMLLMEKVARTTAALVETIQERRPKATTAAQNEKQKQEDDGSVTAAELFTAALSTLSGTLSSSSSASTVEDGMQVVSPLLEILRRVIPHASSLHPRLFLSQLPLLLRLNRALLLSSSSSSGHEQSVNYDQSVLACHACRTVGATLLALQNLSSKQQQQQQWKQYQDKVHDFLEQCIMPLIWSNNIAICSSPKLRQEARAILLESLMTQQQQQQHNNESTWISNWFYNHSYTLLYPPPNNNNKNKSTTNYSLSIQEKIYLLEMIASTTSTYAWNHSISITIKSKWVESLLGMAITSLQKLQTDADDDDNSTTKSKLYWIMITSILDTVSHMMPEQSDHQIIHSSSNNNNNNNIESINQMASRTLATLLRIDIPSSSSNNNNKEMMIDIKEQRETIFMVQEQCYLSFITCIAQCTRILLLESTTNTKYIIIVMKLFPLIITKLILLGANHNYNNNENEEEVDRLTSMSSSELQRLIRTLFTVISSSKDDDDDDDMLANKQTCIEATLRAISSTLIRLQNQQGHWYFAISAYVDAICLSHDYLLSNTKKNQIHHNDNTNDDDDNDDDDNMEQHDDKDRHTTNSSNNSNIMIKMLKPHVRTLMIDYYIMTNTNNDNNDSSSSARVVLESAITSLVITFGIETIWTMIQFTSLSTMMFLSNNNNEETNDDDAIVSKKLFRNGNDGTYSLWVISMFQSSFSSSSSNTNNDNNSNNGTSLGFFLETIVSLAKSWDGMIPKCQQQKKKIDIAKQMVMALWSLFPGFCIEPCDLEEEDSSSSSSSILSTLCRVSIGAMTDIRYPRLLTIICSGLQMLAIGISTRAQKEDENEKARNDVHKLSEASIKLLPNLFRMVESLHGTRTVDGTAIQQTSNDENNSITNNSELQQKIQSVIGAIAELAKVVAPPRPFLSNLFQKVMHRLLSAIQQSSNNNNNDDDNTTTTGREALELQSERICTLLDLAQALVSSHCLDEASISLLYRSMKPLLLSDDNDDDDNATSNKKVQKKSYKVLSEICICYTNLIIDNDGKWLNEMIQVMVGSVISCHVSSRYLRLKCLTHIVGALNKNNAKHMAILPKLLGEVLLCLKDSNAKTREAAYQLLLTMCNHLYNDNIMDFIKLILAALGSTTSHMRSAAVMALSRLIFEYARSNNNNNNNDDEEEDNNNDDVLSNIIMPDLVKTVIVLLDERSREVEKSVVGFVRVAIVSMSQEALDPLLSDIVGGLMKHGKGRFRSKIKIILKKLARMYGYDRISSLVPESDIRLVTHMRKLSERAARRKAANRPDGNMKNGGSSNDDFDDMMESDEEGDSDDGKTLLTGMTKFTRLTGRTSGRSSIRSLGTTTKTTAKTNRSSAMSMAGVSKKSRMSSSDAGGSSSGPKIRAEKVGEVMDMLDSTMTANVRYQDDQNDYGSDLDDDDDDDIPMDFDEQGRLVVVGDDLSSNGPKDMTGDDDDDNDDDDDEENAEIKGGGKKRRINSKFESAKKAREGTRNLKQKNKGGRDNNVKPLGAAFKSKKSGGDVQKKGQKFEPYAYVPLNAKNYSKKNRRKAVAQMATVVKQKKRKRG